MSLTGTLVSPGDLEACHRMMPKRLGDCQVLQQKKRNDVIFKRKSINGKSNDLVNLGFTSGIYIKRRSVLLSAWIFSNCIYIKLGVNSGATRIKQVCDIEKSLNMENIDPYLDINVWISLVTTCSERNEVWKIFFLTVIYFNSISDWIIFINFSFLTGIFCCLRKGDGYFPKKRLDT